MLSSFCERLHKNHFLNNMAVKMLTDKILGNLALIENSIKSRPISQGLIKTRAPRS